MPTYQGQISEEGVIALVEYIKNLNSNYRVQQTLNTTDLLPESEAGAATGKPGARGERGGEAMSSTIVTLPDQSTARIPKINYLTKENGLLSWLLTGDHKRIAMLYLISITFFFFIGGALAGLIRLELLTPQSDLMATDTYNKVFTMHGVIMVFLFLVPSVPATLGNFLIPHHGRRQGSGAAQDQPAELVSVRCRRHHGDLHHGRPAAWIRAGRSPPRSRRIT